MKITRSMAVLRYANRFRNVYLSICIYPLPPPPPSLPLSPIFTLEAYFIWEAFIVLEPLEVRCVSGGGRGKLCPMCGMSWRATHWHGRAFSPIGCSKSWAESVSLASNAQAVLPSSHMYSTSSFLWSQVVTVVGPESTFYPDHWLTMWLGRFYFSLAIL